MNYSEATRQLADFRKQIGDIRAQMRKIQATIEPQPVRDYEFSTVDGPVKLSTLFGKSQDLFMVHNMGSSCPYCTLWADGYNGVYSHLANRAAFVLSSPDSPATQREFAAGRGWVFRMVSHAGTSFADDMGYRSKGGGWLPGVSVFRRDGERILRLSDVGLAPGDDFCTVWHLFDLLPEGPGTWAPKFRYT